MTGGSDEGAGGGDRPGGRLVLLSLLVALLLTGVDLFMLGISVAFGPTGFGGDRTPSRAEEARAVVGEVAGVAALVLGAAAFAAAAAVRRGRARGRVVAALVGAQAASVAVLVGSTMA